MDGRILAFAAVRRQTVVELHLSTLSGLHVIPAMERIPQDVMQTTIRGRWEAEGVFHCITGERLIVGADGRARWGRDDWQGAGAYRWDGR